MGKVNGKCKPIVCTLGKEDYPARARKARAQKACALRGLGLLLADGALTVGRGKTFWRVNWFFFYGNGCNLGTESRKIGPKVGNEQSLRGLQTGHWPKLGSYGKNWILDQKPRFWAQKSAHFWGLAMFWPRPEKVVQRKKLPLPK